VTVTLSAADIPARSVDLALVDSQWRGALGDIPSGSDRSFSAEAFDASGTRRFVGQVSGITIAPGATAAVALVLQQVGTAPSLDNAVPGVTALLLSSDRIRPEGSLALEVRAHDPNPADTLAYSWTATAGAFSSPSSPATSWTAPQDEGPVTVTVTVTDSRGASASHSFTLNVGTFPPEVVSTFTRSPPPGSGLPVSLHVAAWEPQGGSLSFSWSSDRGRLGTSTSGPTSSQLLWTPPSCVPEGAVPVVSVTVRSSFGLSTVATFPLSEPLHACTPGTWTPWTRMSAPRYQHTATLLPSGKVLVTGGTHKNHNPPEAASAEVYDPATRSWSPTGPMLVSRQEHTATLLPSGKVLVTGGTIESWTTLSSAELYDPATHQWSGTSSLSSVRARHIAVLLPTGKVLVAGGALDGIPQATAELYDPATGTWSPTGSMRNVRSNAAATLLRSGKVLVTGGTDARYYAQALAELYDPATGTWTPTTSNPLTARARHTSTLLPSGRVLLTGGFIFDGSGPYHQIDSAELYDPTTDSWLPTQPMAMERSGHTATLLPDSERVLVAGGRWRHGSLATAELYDIATGTWSPAASLSTTRFEGTATALGSDTVLLIGGRQYSFSEPRNDEIIVSQATTELYAP
jgi:N-acetylneuraminic acid mutarotase